MQRIVIVSLTFFFRHFESMDYPGIAKHLYLELAVYGSFIVVACAILLVLKRIVILFIEPVGALGQ